jgi:hypothetical protein
MATPANASQSKRLQIPQCRPLSSIQLTREKISILNRLKQQKIQKKRFDIKIILIFAA